VIDRFFGALKRKVSLSRTDTDSVVMAARLAHATATAAAAAQTAKGAADAPSRNSSVTNAATSVRPVSPLAVSDANSARVLPKAARASMTLSLKMIGQHSAEELLSLYEKDGSNMSSLTLLCTCLYNLSASGATADASTTSTDLRAFSDVCVGHLDDASLLAAASADVDTPASSAIGAPLTRMLERVLRMMCCCHVQCGCVRVSFSHAPTQARVAERAQSLCTCCCEASLHRCVLCVSVH
jgi:hypothetical protein